MDIKAFDLYVGQQVRAARIEAGMTQAELGVAIGLSGSSAQTKVVRIESGVSAIDFSRIVLIAKATKKSLYWFTGDFLR